MQNTHLAGNGMGYCKLYRPMAMAKPPDEA